MEQTDGRGGTERDGGQGDVNDDIMMMNCCILCYTSSVMNDVVEGGGKLVRSAACHNDRNEKREVCDGGKGSIVDRICLQ